MSGLSEHIDLREIAPQPWKNGTGLTRELAVMPPGAGMERFDWRISVAEITRDAPFSAFPGVDRCIVLLRGAGVHLGATDGGADHRLERPYEPLHFSGDAHLMARLINGPSHDLNVMTRRGRWRADVTHHATSTRSEPADAGMLLCGDGTWLVDSALALQDSASLHSLHALLWRRQMPALQARPSDARAHLIIVRLHSVRPGGAA